LKQTIAILANNHYLPKSFFSSAHCTYSSYLINFACF